MEKKDKTLELVRRIERGEDGIVCQMDKDIYDKLNYLETIKRK